MDFIGHDKGPGIAAGALVMALIEMLVEKKVLAADDPELIVKRAFIELGNRPSQNMAVQDAQRVLDKMLARLTRV